jgi:ribonuclease J
MKYTIHRGTREIGGSCVEVRTERTRMLLDMGFPLHLHGQTVERVPTDADPKQLLASGILPRIEGLYAWDEPRFDAVLLSHAHLDHTGLLPWLHPSIPVYLSAGTRTLLSIGQRFLGQPHLHNDLRTLPMYNEILIGDIAVTTYLMDHSAVDAVAFALKADDRTLVYSGDFRGHGRKASCLPTFLREAPKNPDVLLIEGTQMSRNPEPALTEDDLDHLLTERLQPPGPVLFQCSSQNLDRLVGLYKACRRTHRLLVVDVYTANVLHELAQLGMKFPDPLTHRDLRVFFPQAQTTRLLAAGEREAVYRFVPRKISKLQIEQEIDRVCWLVRPNQRIHMTGMPGLVNGRLIWSMWEGYRADRPQIALERFLEERGFTVESLHTSGHASVQDLQRVISALDPVRVVPIHGTTPEGFLALSDKVVLAEDGQEVSC